MTKMFFSKWKLKTRKIMIPFTFFATCKSLMSIKENTDRKKKEERMKKNADRTQPKMNGLHVRYNVKTLPQ